MKPLLILLAVALAYGHYEGLELVVPSYFEGLGKDAIDEYNAILFDADSTIAEKEQKIDDWAKKHNTQALMQEYKTNMEKDMKEAKQNVKKLITELPEAFEKFTKVFENDNQTLTSLTNGLEKLTAENPKLYHLLQCAFEMFTPENQLPQDFAK